MSLVALRAACDACVLHGIVLTLFSCTIMPSHEWRFVITNMPPHPSAYHHWQRTEVIMYSKTHPTMHGLFYVKISKHSIFYYLPTTTRAMTARASDLLLGEPALDGYIPERPRRVLDHRARPFIRRVHNDTSGGHRRSRTARRTSR